MRALALTLLLVLGCTDPPLGSPEFSDGGPETPAVVGMTYAWSFDKDAKGALAAPWFEVLGDWHVVDGAVVQAGEFAGPAYPRVLLEGLQFSDLKMSVRCRMELGNVDRACGILFRAVDSENYYVTRANVLEDNIRLYRVVDGDRQQFASAERTVNGNEWQTLAVEATGNRVTVSWNGEKVIDATDDTFITGVVGLWTKADSITRFDDLTVVAR
jgi:hypothetical protein